jgi:hypothetical protein
MTMEPKTTVNLPWSPEELAALRQKRTGQWDEWYERLPDDLKRRLSFHDLTRLGDLFKEVFEVS